MASKKKDGGASIIKFPSRNEKALELLDMVNKKMKGRAQLKMASDYVLPFATKRMPTGLLSLDVELRGGFPCGGLSQIVGPKNATKTYLAWQVIRQQQFYKGDDFMCLLAMTEMRADRTQARLAGVAISLGDGDIDELERARMAQGNPKFTKEERVVLRKEIGTIHEVHGDSAETLFDIVLKAVHENIYHLIIIDSFGSIMAVRQSPSPSSSASSRRCSPWTTSTDVPGTSASSASTRSGMPSASPTSSSRAPAVVPWSTPSSST
jgi:RecA/RadA recombinase